MGRSPSVADRSSKLLKYNRIYQFAPLSRCEIGGERGGPVADAGEGSGLCARRLEKPPHLAVAAFFQDDPIPAVGAGGFSLLADRGERCLAIFELDSGAELLEVGVALHAS